MLKVGITRRENFLTRHRGGVFGPLFDLFSKGRVSYSLLEQPRDPSPEDSALFERLMPFIQLSSGTYRTTYRARFRNLDPVVNRVLAVSFDAKENLQIEDWAASACLTSSEWAQSLFPLFPRLHFFASDILLFLVELRDEDGAVFIFEPQGQPLQFVRPPFVVRLSPMESWMLPVNYWLALKAWNRWRSLRKSLGSIQSWVDSPSEGVLHRDGFQFRKLSLVHPEATQLEVTDSRFRTRSQSIFAPLASPIHVIRTMNIFNRAYFSPEMLTKGIVAVTSSLLPGGIWILGRTVQEEPPVHEVTIYRKEGAGKLRVIERIGPGSEIEALALSTTHA